MTLDEFKQIAKRIEDLFCAAPGGHKFSELEFEDWWQSFQNENADVVNEAVTLMKEEYGYFPMVVTLKTYIEKVERFRRERAEREAVENHKASPEEIEKSNKARARYSRFVFYLLENRIRPEYRSYFWGKWSGDKFESELRKFEKDHPNWKRKEKPKESKPGMQSIRRVLRDGDVFPSA